MSARAVAVIRPAPIIISLPLFLCILSGKRQLHASRVYRDSLDHRFAHISCFMTTQQEKESRK
jgi:hypothetical protein